MDKKQEEKFEMDTHKEGTLYIVDMRVKNMVGAFVYEIIGYF